MRLSSIVAIIAASGVASAAHAAEWTVDRAHSTIGFEGKQSGTPFSGTFKSFSAAISFDPAAPQSAHVLATIDMTSASTGDPQKDGAIPGPDWFAAAKFPQAVFEATGFKPGSADHYEADGTLSIRDVKKSVVLPFTLTINGGDAHAVGSVVLMRQDYGVGQGVWSKDDNVAFDVAVTIDLHATAK